MQQMHELESRKKQEETDYLRIKAAMKVMQANFVGDMKKCKKDLSPSEVENYCMGAYQDFEEVENCKDPEEICYSCCNHEFGILKMAQRDNCQMTMCGEKKYWVWKKVL